MKNKSNALFVGIDPGGSGGIAVITPDGKMHAMKMPATEHDTNNIISHIKTFDCTVYCLIEGVHSFPAQGVASSFKFGRNYGMLRGLLVGNKIPFNEVSPMKWQKMMGIPSRKEKSRTDHKNVLKAKAQQMCPDLKITLATADAILIALYCKLINK